MLFGHQDNAAQHSVAQVAPTQSAPASQPVPQDSAVNPLAVDPDTGASYPATQSDSPHPLDHSAGTVGAEPSVLDQPSASDSPYQSFESFSASDPAPTTPFGTDQAVQPQQPAPAPVHEAPAAPPVQQQQPETSSGAPMAHLTPAFSDQSAAAQPVPAPAPAVSPAPAASVSGSDDLLDLKQQALNQLGPLINQLDQAPEEKFRTTMMLIQSTDNATLLKQAYEAAQRITDEKARAQALLDVVNEINYFTQQASTDAATM